MIIYSPAVIAKIRRDMLKASEKTKARICRKLYHKIAEKDFITFQSHMADLIYWLESVLKHTAPELVGLKLCLFHLMTQAITNRKNHTFAKLYYEDTFLFFQEKYHCFDEKDPRQIALLNFKVHKNDFKTDWQAYF